MHQHEETTNVSIYQSKSFATFQRFGVLECLHTYNPTFFAHPIGYLNSARVIFPEGLSPPTSSAVLLEEAEYSVESYLTRVENRSSQEVMSRLESIAADLISITQVALECHVVLLGLALKQLLVYGQHCKLADVEGYVFLGDIIYPYALKSHHINLAPELMASLSGLRGFAGSPVDEGHATWALGCVLFELFSGIRFSTYYPSKDRRKVSAILEQKYIDDVLAEHLPGNSNWIFRIMLQHFLKIEPSSRMMASKLSLLQERLAAGSVLAIMMEHGADDDNYIDLIHSYPMSVSIPDTNGMLPVFMALQLQVSSTVVKLMLDSYPEATKLTYPGTDTSLIHYAVDQNMSAEYIDILLPYFMPVHPVTGEPTDHHRHGWTRVISHTNPPDKYLSTVRDILNVYSAHVESLSSVLDEAGRVALHVATPKCKAEILSYVYFMQRYEFKGGSAEHQSATCIVRFATDTEEGKNVALKFMRSKAQFVREYSTRQSSQFSEDYVLGILRTLDSDSHVDIEKEFLRKGFQNYRYCLIMPQAERTLQSILAHEHIAGKDWGQIKLMGCQILMALQHLHEKEYVHGDVKRMYLRIYIYIFFFS